MTVHIVIPFYGEPRYLEDAVASVRAQRNADWLLTVVDDGYPGTRAAEHLRALGDDRIEYRRNDARLGPNGNTYRCSRLGRTEYLCMMGADDLLEPDYLDVVLAGFRRGPDVVAVQPGVTVIDEDGAPHTGLTDRVKAVLGRRARERGEIAGEAAARSLLLGNWLYTPALCYRSSAVADVPFHEGIDAIHDLAFVMDLLVRGGRLVLEPAVAFRYRRHRSSDSSTRARDGIRFEQEQRYYREVADELRGLGWNRAARAADLHVFSRLHALTMAASLVAGRDLRRAGAMVGRALR